jgi:hypothetical protein
MDTTNIGICAETPAPENGTTTGRDPREPSAYQQAKARREARERAAFEAELREALAKLPAPFVEALELIQSHIRTRLQALPPDQQRSAAHFLGFQLRSTVHTLALQLQRLDQSYREVFGEPEPPASSPVPLALVEEEATDDPC